MSGNIFLLDNNHNVVELTEAKYESEDLFQQLIEQYPGILAGDQITPDQPRKWIFVSREMGVPSHDGGNAQWFLDHLFIDQDAIPTFIEVKRSTDTRIRREVVAQMLDYAANATAYWPIEGVRSTYEATCAKQGIFPLENLGLSESEADGFWEKVHSNLRLGKIRLIFVADEIPETLRRIIEFLNGQMTDTEVIGVEIKQYISNGGYTTLVPKVIGQTTAAIQVKSKSDFVWTEEPFLDHVEKTADSESFEICKRLLQEFTRMGCYIYWGKGQKLGGFTPVYVGNQRHQLASIYSYSGKIRAEICFQYLKAPFDTKEKQTELLNKFNRLPGVNISEEKLFKRPSLECSIFANRAALEQYINIYKNIIREIREYESTH